MKILVLCYEYPPVGGGGGRVAAQVAAGLVRRGHQVRVLTAGMRHLPGHEIREGVEILRPASFRRSEDTCSVPEMALYLATGLLPVVLQVRGWQPDVVHAHFAVPTGPLALAAHVVSEIPYVLTVHLGDVPGGVPEQTDHLFRFVDPFVRPVWQRASRVTAVSRFVAGLAKKAAGIDPLVIPNGVKALPRPEIKLHQPCRVVMAGRLSVQKNPLLALDALSRLGDLPWTLDIIGDGPLLQDMRDRAAKLHLTDRVTFHGWLPADQVAAVLARSDLLVMTSLHEGLPMIAIEALQHGLAIAGSAIGGMRDVVDERKNGVLCELTPESFSAKLRELFTNPALLGAMRRASRDKAAEFDGEKTVAAYEQVLATAARRQKK